MKSAFFFLGLMLCLPGVCLGYLRADFDESGIVDFVDFSEFSDQWLQEDSNITPLNIESKGTATFTVAANDTELSVIAMADYKCDGINDDVEIQLAIDALDMAVLHRNPPEGCIFHSDRGIQYASSAFRDKVKTYKMIQSMSRKGNCWDNAPAESFFSTLKMEEVYIQKKYKTRDEARKRIFEYIEVFYNRQRTHSFLDFMSPVEYEESILKMAA